MLGELLHLCDNHHQIMNQLDDIGICCAVSVGEQMQITGCLMDIIIYLTHSDIVAPYGVINLS